MILANMHYLCVKILVNENLAKKSCPFGPFYHLLVNVIYIKYTNKWRNGQKINDFFSEKTHLVVFKDNIQYNTIIQYPLFNLVNVLS